MRQIEQVVVEDRLALEQVEAVAAEAAAQSHDHSFRPAFGDRHLGGDGVVLVQNAGSIADGNAGILTRVGENRFPGDRARSRRQEAREARVIQGEDLVFRRLRQEQRLHFLQLVGHLRGEVVVFRVVFGDVVKLPLVAVMTSGSLPVPRSQGAAGGVVAAIQPSW